MNFASTYAAKNYMMQLTAILTAFLTDILVTVYDFFG
jgi:hypothetical protein